MFTTDHDLSLLLVDPIVAPEPRVSLQRDLKEQGTERASCRDVTTVTACSFKTRVLKEQLFQYPGLQRASCHQGTERARKTTI